MQRQPDINEYAAFYSTYVKLVPEGDIVLVLKEQVKETISLLESLSEAQACFRYARNKWSLKEVVGHMTDTERIMGYRLLCIARGETESLPGFNENDYVASALFDQQLMSYHLENLAAVRKATLLLLKSLDEEAWLRRGKANDYDVTVRALAYIIAGHELHHRQIMKERYFGAGNFPSY